MSVMVIDVDQSDVIPAWPLEMKHHVRCFVLCMNDGVVGDANVVMPEVVCLGVLVWNGAFLAFLPRFGYFPLVFRQITEAVRFIDFGEVNDFALLVFWEVCVFLLEQIANRKGVCRCQFKPRKN